MEKLQSEIVPFYKNKTIFLTGGSGFVGRVFIEKLLRVTEVHCIYVLMRPKRGMDIQERVAAWSSDLLFERLLKSHPNALQKVVPISGDCQEPDLGISLEDRQLLREQVQLVVHSAASVRFVEPLHVAVDTNTRATHLMLQLAKEIRHLEAFVHVSTAYSNCVINHTEEKFYPNHLNCSFDKVLKMREMLDEKVFDNLAPVLVDKFPNTYIYTKALGEQAIQTESGQLPVCVIRPGAIISSDKEPVSGYVDNTYGPLAFQWGVAKGFLRIMPVDLSASNPILPVDLCVNLIITGIWKTAQLAAQGTCQTPPAIYNHVPHPNNLLKSSDFVDLSNQQLQKTPLEKSIWYPFVISVNNRWLYKIGIIFYHIMPAYVLDMILRLQGKKPRLVKLYQKVHKNIDVLSFFSRAHLSFDIANTSRLWKSLSKADQQLFPFDMEFFNFKEHIERTVPGMRTYFLKEEYSEESFERGRKRLKRQFIYHWLLLISIGCILLAIGRWLLLLWR